MWRALLGSGLFAMLAACYQKGARWDYPTDDCSDRVADDGHLNANNTAEDVRVCIDVYTDQCKEELETIRRILDCPDREKKSDCHIDLMTEPPDQLPLFICGNVCNFRISANSPHKEVEGCEKEQVTTYNGQLAGMELLCGRPIAAAYQLQESFDWPENCHYFLDQ